MYEEITDSEIEAGKAVTTELMRKYRDGLKSHEERLNTYVASSENTVIVNEGLVAEDTLPVGTVLFAGATDIVGTGNGDSTIEAFSKNGTWFLCDGSKAIGYDYANDVPLDPDRRVPDLRGRFPRMRTFTSGSNPDGNLAAGSVSTDKLKTHTHDDTFDLVGTTVFATPGHAHNMNHYHQIGKMTYTSGGELRVLFAKSPAIGVDVGAQVDMIMKSEPQGASAGSTYKQMNGVFATQGDHTLYTGNSSSTDTGSADASAFVALDGSILSFGANETAPKATHLNAFIKVHRNYLGPKTFRKKVAINCTVNTIKINIEWDTGASGTASIGVKKALNYTGTRASILTTATVSIPTNNTDAKNTGFSISNIADGELEAGEYLFVELNSTQLNRIKSIHVFVSAIVI